MNLFYFLLKNCAVKIFAFIVLQLLFALSVQAQTSVIIYVGDNSVIHNVSAIYGDYTFIGKKQNKTVTKTSRKESYTNGIAINSFKKNKNQNKKIHSEIVYSPFSPFANSAFKSNAGCANTVLPVQYTQDYKLFFTKIHKSLILNILFKINDFIENDYVQLRHNTVAFAVGNLPPPDNFPQIF